MKTSRHWTIEEDNYLKSNIDKLSDKEIGQNLNRSHNAIYLRISKLKLRDNPQHWKEIELNYLKENYNKLSLHELSNNLSRGKRGIQCKASELNLTIQDKLWTDKDINFLITAYKKIKVTSISKHLNRTKYSIHTKARELKLSVNQETNYFYYDIPSKYFKKLKYGAKKRGLLFEITMEDIWNQYLKQNKKCMLTGQLIQFSGNLNLKNKASVDRIDSSKGYTKDNIQILDKDINIMKLKFNQQYFISLCNKVTVYNKK